MAQVSWQNWTCNNNFYIFGMVALLLYRCYVLRMLLSRLLLFDSGCTCFCLFSYFVSTFYVFCCCSLLCLVVVVVHTHIATPLHHAHIILTILFILITHRQRTMTTIRKNVTSIVQTKSTAMMIILVVMIMVMMVHMRIFASG